MTGFRKRDLALATPILLWGVAFCIVFFTVEPDQSKPASPPCNQVEENQP